MSLIGQLDPDELAPSTRTAWLELLNEDLPAHVHATVLTATDTVHGRPLVYPVVWADRAIGHCDHCEETIAWDLSDDCPLLLDAGSGIGGSIEVCSQEHGCGEWLSVAWVDDLAYDTIENAEHDMLAAAQKLANERSEALGIERKRITARLRNMLARAHTRLAEPLDVGETTADRERDVLDRDEEPGVCRDENDQLMAWDFDPDPARDDPDDIICVRERDLEIGRA